MRRQLSYELELGSKFSPQLPEAEVEDSSATGNFTIANMDGGTQD